jgi:rod shape-determining protein MreD
MRYFKTFLLLFLVYIFQTVVMSRFSILGVNADLLLIMTVFFAINYGVEDGFVAGLISGLLLDVFGGYHLVHTISMSVLGFLLATFKESVLGTEDAVALSAVAVATVTNFLFELILFFFFFGKPLGAPLYIVPMLFLSVIYNSLLTPLLYPLMRRLMNVLFA